MNLTFAKKKNKITKTMNAMDYYYCWVLGVIAKFAPAVAVFAALYLNIMKLLGYYPDTSVAWMVIFDAVCVVFAIIGIYVSLHKVAMDGRINRIRLKKIESIVCVCILIQWNMISYVFPTRNFWGFAPFFILIMALFFDEKYVLINSIGILVSTAVSWIILPDKLLPLSGDNFIPEMWMRSLALVLGIGCVNVIALFGGKMLVRELRYLSDYDKLTGFMSRRRFDEFCEEPKAFLIENDIGYNVAVMDFDDFKAINDTYGHINGDEVLSRFGQVVSKVACDKDKVFRIGGEEFLFVIPGPVTEARALCESICDAFKKEVFDFNGEKIHVTITVGLTHFDRLDGLPEAAKAADQNMYKGKNEGKDRIVA